MTPAGVSERLLFIPDITETEPELFENRG